MSGHELFEHPLYVFLLTKSGIQDCFKETGDILFYRVYDTFWDMWEPTDDTVWLRQHLIGVILQEEDCVPGSGAAAMMIDLMNATEIADYGIACTGILIGGTDLFGVDFFFNLHNIRRH